MIVSGVDCRYGALLLAHLCLFSGWYQFEMLENAGSRLFWYISDFIWLLCVCLASQSFYVWKLRERLKVVSCVGDCCALLNGFRILVLSACERYAELYFSLRS